MNMDGCADAEIISSHCLSCHSVRGSFREIRIVWTAMAGDVCQKGRVRFLRFDEHDATTGKFQRWRVNIVIVGVILTLVYLVQPRCFTLDLNESWCLH